MPFGSLTDAGPRAYHVARVVACMRSGLPALLLTLVAVAGCAGATVSTSVPTATGTPAATSTPAATVQVSIAKYYRFDPKVIQVNPGTAVTWTNDDIIAHDVHFLSGADFTSEVVKVRESTSYLFSKPGNYLYECVFHPNMKGEVQVVTP